TTEPTASGPSAFEAELTDLLAAVARFFARAVKREVTRRIDPEAAFERHVRRPRKAIAALKGAATGEIRGRHVRQRPAGKHGRRFPRVDQRCGRTV
ncbi:MAG TPA: hypothetical protein VMB50_00105, partial [Myxococcales bacterium]|nr:hypothetical protein [Myxococcales bacterium]